MVIGAGASPLAASHLFVVSILVLWVRLETSQQLNLDMRSISAGSHIEH
jgi:hypothetical protein